MFPAISQVTSIMMKVSPATLGVRSGVMGWGVDMEHKKQSNLGKPNIRLITDFNDTKNEIKC